MGEAHEHAGGQGAKLGWALLGTQTFIVLCYFGLDYNAKASSDIPVNVEVTNYYGGYMDVHVMIFIGFGYLMTFLYRHGYGSIGYNFFIAALVAQWAMVVVPVTSNLVHHNTGFK